jgi:hypothetical protein
MYYEKETNASNFAAGVLVGALLGAGLALLLGRDSPTHELATVEEVDALDRHAILAELKQRRRARRR